MLKQKQAFTLVELIVVITIVAILGTIAFISLQGYTENARDSVRISDIGKIKTSLELFQLDSGKYPQVTDSQEITYSGFTAWNQGIFGVNTFNNVAKLDKVPLDPLTNKEYIYSVTENRQEYELAGIIESGELGFISDVFAGDNLVGVKVDGNYNGKILKIIDSGIVYLLAVPSIISSSGTTVEFISTNNTFVYDGYKNLPMEYEGLSYNVLGEEGIKFVNSDNLEVFSGSLGLLSQKDDAGIEARLNLIENLKLAFTGSIIENESQIKEILLVDVNNSDSIELLTSTIIVNNLGGDTIFYSDGKEDDEEQQQSIIDDFTVLLLKGDGVDGTNNFIDSSNSSHVVNVVGDVKHSTNSSKFGGSSIYFDGSGDYLTLADSVDWTFGAEDWTIDFWFNFPSSYWTTMLSFHSPETIQIMHYFSGYGMCFQIGSANDYNKAGQVYPSFNEWHHLALVRNGGIITQYIDGVSTGDTYSIGTNALADPTSLSIGQALSGWIGNYKGYLDEIRISKGIARWTTNFVPPTTEY